MVEIIYRAGLDDPKVTTWRGQTFISGESNDITDEAMIESARGNPHFDVDGESKADKAKAAAEAQTYEQAKATMANIRAGGEELDAKHDKERREIEAKHDAEHRAYMDANKPAFLAAQDIVIAHDAPLGVRHASDDLPLNPNTPASGLPKVDDGSHTAPDGAEDEPELEPEVKTPPAPPPVENSGSGAQQS